jgi:beta-glucosidase
MNHSESPLLNRRAVIATAAGSALLAASGTGTTALGATKAMVNAFPKGFHWGCATAAYQIEGNNTASDLWHLENTTPTTFVERSGDTCDSYHRYEEDIALLARLGFNSYRFSIDWSRIEPTRGYFSSAELDYYQRVIACCQKYRVAPAVTFFHGAAPRWFAMAGGWLNPEAPALFARFCSTAAKAMARDMSYAFTINEPQVGAVFRAIPGASAYFTRQDQLSLAAHTAAAKSLNSERFVTTDYPDGEGMTPLLIAGHEQGYAAIKAENSHLPVGVTLSVTDFQPGGEGSPYLEIRRKAYGAWLDTIKRSGDFTGVQSYRLIRIPGTGQALAPLPPLPFTDPGDRVADMQRPEALGNTVEYIHAETNKPIVVSENGIETENDARRVWYIDGAIASLHATIAKGVPVLGYYHWSLLDNFEWTRGYKPRFGLVAVDRTTFKRTPKPSAVHLGAIARRNAI